MATTLPPLLLFILLGFLLLSSPATATPTLLACAGNYTTNGTFSSNLKSNLKALLFFLNSTGPANSGYTRYIAGNGSDAVYGLAICRGDIDPTDCLQCLKNAVKDLPMYCPNARLGDLFYDACQLRYEDWNFFGRVNSIAGHLVNENNVTASQIQLFGDRLNRLMNATTNYAVSNSSGRLFATGQVNFTARYPLLYGAVQCTRDLAPEQCRECLQTIVNQIPYCCDRSLGGRVVSASCNLRFEIYTFFNGEPDVTIDTDSSHSNTTATTPSGQEPTTNATGIGNGSKRKTGVILVASISSLAAACLLLSAACIVFFRRTKPPSNQHETGAKESLLFELSTLKAATENFSTSNKLGEGGFGSVYKGLLGDGREIAVKRLSKNSGQGLRELKAELELAARINHKNLVRLLGICLDQQEKLLVYEYVPNLSLDTFLFDEIRSRRLDWKKRYNIILGIARGLHYLHEDSRVRIIHRDLKAANILLDAEMNPKIADFGLARLFSIDQSLAATNKIAGTLGYMAPEYVGRRIYSTKSDVFSFGVLVLEIVSGKNNKSFADPEAYTNLLTYVWEHWTNRKVEEIVDGSLQGNFLQSQAMQCVQIGLLCVQEDPAKRPKMSSVNLMLSNTSMTIGVPSRPAFIVRRNIISHEQSTGSRAASATEEFSANEMSITDVEAR